MSIKLFLFLNPSSRYFKLPVHMCCITKPPFWNLAVLCALLTSVPCSLFMHLSLCYLRSLAFLFLDSDQWVFTVFPCQGFSLWTVISCSLMSAWEVPTVQAHKSSCSWLMDLEQLKQYFIMVPSPSSCGKIRQIDLRQCSIEIW